MPTALKPMPARPAYLRAGVATGRPVRVDREARVIRGYAVADEGGFKTPGRGAFDRLSLQQVVDAYRPHRDGLKVRFQHPSASDDGLGKHLGRSKNPWIDASGPVWRVRADLHLADAASKAPAGDLAEYVMSLAEEDPDALSSSLCVTDHDEEYRLNKDGTPVTDATGEPLPPLWRIKALHASDVVDTGDAVGGLLSAHPLDIDALPDALQRRGWEALDALFAGQPADVIRSRTAAYVERYLAARNACGSGTTSVAPVAEQKSVTAPTVRFSLTVGPSVAGEKPTTPARPNRERAGRILDRIRRAAR